MMITWESSDCKWSFSAVRLDEMIIAGRGEKINKKQDIGLIPGYLSHLELKSPHFPAAATPLLCSCSRTLES